MLLVGESSGAITGKRESANRGSGPVVRRMVPYLFLKTVAAQMTIPGCRNPSTADLETPLPERHPLARPVRREEDGSAGASS